MRKHWKWIVGVVVVVVLAVVVAPWVYINFIREDAEPEFQLTDATGTVPDTTGAASDTTAPAASASGIDGTWSVSAGSSAGYRAKEVLFGQDAEATGRTDQVTGSIEISGTTVASGSFEV